MSVCAAPTCSHQSFDGSSYYVDVDVDMSPFCIVVTVDIIMNVYLLLPLEGP